ncbi:DMT family transporter [Moraxella marmotae]|uniref:DMT family transporter n=1 Tax=Moraxella marmotae TaxID=3344520 RepID=UPI0035F4C24F
MQYVYWLMAFAVGMGSAVQAAINARLAHGLGNQTLSAAFVSFLIGTLCLAAVMLYQNNFGGLLDNLATQPWWRWLGGIIGAGFVFSMAMLAPKIGLVNMVFLVILGQLVAGMAIDLFGLIQMPVRPLSWYKYLGMAVMLVGLLVFMFGDRIKA